MFISDLMKLKMGAPRMLFEGDSGGAGGGSTVMTAGGSAGDGDGGTGTGTGGDGGAGGNGGDGGGKGFGNWRDQVSDDLKGSDFIKGYKGTLSDLVNEHLDVKGKSDKFALPAKDATDEQRATWLKERMTDAGYVIPEDVAGYEVGKPEIPDGMHYDSDSVDTFLKTALGLGVPKHVVQALIKANDDATIAQHVNDEKVLKENMQESIDAMKKEYKDNYKTVIETVHRTAKAFGGEDFFKLLDEATLHGVKLGNHPAFVETFKNIHKEIGEDNVGLWLTGERKGDAPKNVDKFGNPTLDFSKSMPKDGGS
jgi:hypothetical protein